MVDLNQPCTYNARPLKGGVATHQKVGAGWSSLVARRAHNPKVVGSNPAPATKYLYIVCKELVAKQYWKRLKK